MSSLFTNVPVEEDYKSSVKKLHNNDTLVEQSVLQVDVIMELLEVCLRAKCFQMMISSANGLASWPRVSTEFPLPP
jgi:hypothetical protein